MKTNWTVYICGCSFRKRNIPTGKERLHWNWVHASSIPVSFRKPILYNVKTGFTFTLVILQRMWPGLKVSSPKVYTPARNVHPTVSISHCQFQTLRFRTAVHYISSSAILVLCCALCSFVRFSLRQFSLLHTLPNVCCISCFYQLLKTVVEPRD